MKFLRFLLAINLLISLARADVLSDLENYIYARTGESSQEAYSKCGFRDAINLRQYFSQLSPTLQKLAEPLLEMPKRKYQVTSPSGHFVLHYNLEGFHAVPPKDSLGNGIPDYIDSAAVILDHVWEVEIDRLGFNPPPDSEGNPVTSYPVFFSSMNYYGLTNFDLNEDIASLPGNNYSSYLELHNNFQGSRFATKGLEALKVTAAHEFHHAIQLGYQFRWEFSNGVYNYPDLFFLEISSTFMEDYVYDEINDYVQYVNRFIPVADSKSFDAADGNSEYANAIFLQMLTKIHGTEIFRKIWENMVKYPAISAINTTLRNYGDSFADSFSRYACWLYFSGEHADPIRFFKDGGLFTTMRLNTDKESLNDKLESLRMRHVRTPVEESGFFLAKVSSESNSGRMNHIVNGQNIMTPAQFNRSQYFQQQAGKPLIVVLTNSADNDIEILNYEFKLAPAMVDRNPVVVTNNLDRIAFINVPFQSELKIYTVRGRLVKTIHSGNDTRIYWNLRNRFSRKVSSGIYLYLIRGKNFKAAGKLTVLR
ncbi:MAG: T9SS type A sorting domain-containing protein [Calditrichaeota bacterium]|nr:T9SS type A sorting domain-containing protein [Calditrichota bacterium]